MLVDKCPVCGGELQASVPCYLGAVVIGEYGVIQSFEPAFENSYGASLALEPAEVGDRIDLYCENDHCFYFNSESCIWELGE